jgi:hypothetical protein
MSVVEMGMYDNILLQLTFPSMIWIEDIKLYPPPIFGTRRLEIFCVFVDVVRDGVDICFPIIIPSWMEISGGITWEEGRQAVTRDVDSPRARGPEVLVVPAVAFMRLQ